MPISTQVGTALPSAVLAEPLTGPGEALLHLLGPHLGPIAARAGEHDRDGTFPADVFAAFARDGVLGATVPVELGGLGVSRLHDVAVALAVVAAADASTALALHVQCSRGLTLAYEWRHGSANVSALAERVLRGMAAGDVVCGAVKDHPSTVTRLESDGNGGLVLSGRKTLVSTAPVATHFFVYAQQEVDGRTVIAAPLVARDTPGLTILEGWEGLGMRASGTLDIQLDHCPVNPRDVLTRGAVGARDDAVLAGQTVSSITMLGIYAGIAAAAKDIALARARKSAEPPAGVRVLVAEIEARLFGLRSAATAALATADAVDPTLDPAERGQRMMAAFQCAKLIVNRAAAATVEDCLTIVGSAAYDGRHPLARLHRDVRAGWFMQPHTYPDAVDFLSAHALRLDRDNDYMSRRAGSPGGR